MISIARYGNIHPSMLIDPSQGELTTALQGAAVSVEACVFVGGTLIWGSGSALDGACRRVSVRIVFANPSTKWVLELVKDAGASSSDYQKRILSNLNRAQNMGASVRMTDCPLPEWLVVVDRTLAFAKPIRPRGPRATISRTEQPKDLKYYVEIFKRAWSSQKTKQTPQSANPHRQLSEFICEAFSASELRRFLVEGLGYRQLLYELPGDGSTMVDLAFHMVEALCRRGLIDQEFFSRLRRERPTRELEVEVLKDLWL